MLCRLIAPQWLVEDQSSGLTPRVLEGDFSKEQILQYNQKGYNVYYLPNRPKDVKAALSVAKNREDRKSITGDQIDLFQWVFVDMDLKDGNYKSKEAFIEKLKSDQALLPTLIVDSGNGVHAYWKVSDLDLQSYPRLSKRAIRKFNTDESVYTPYQLMRLPGTLNTKDRNNKLKCAIVFKSDKVYTAEELNNLLPPITPEDEQKAKYSIDSVTGALEKKKVNYELPQKFNLLLRQNSRAKDLFFGAVQDRSRADFELGHILYADGFSEEEAMSVLVNVEKAKERRGSHQVSYAQNIINKIWVEKEELKPLQAKSVADLLGKNDGSLEHPRLYGHRLFDATQHGFRLTEVMGFIGGSGVGKTSSSLNQFKWFVQYNPEYIHLFVSLEQPASEIANRWSKMCGNDSTLHNRVYIIDNYTEEGDFKHLSLDEIKEEVFSIEKTTGRKIGCVVIDHIGIIKATPKNDGEFGGVQSICEAMKPFARATNTFLIMQSQTSRAKASIGDIELDKDAAYGTSLFENFCDYVITIWQPLKRVYSEMENDHKLTVVAYKFCKIRHKDVKKDSIQEDVVYACFFDPETETMRRLTSDEYEVYSFWNKQATVLRNKDKKSSPAEIVETTWVAVDE